MMDCTLSRISGFKHEKAILFLGFKNTPYMIEYLVFLSMNSTGEGNNVVMKTAANEKVSSTSTENEDLNIK